MMASHRISNHAQAAGLAEVPLPSGAPFLSAQVARVLAGQIPIGFHFQPIVDLPHATVTGYEALLRLPPGLALPPDRFFAAAAQSGLQVEIEELVLRKALESRSQLPPNCFLTVNVSPVFMLSSRWPRFIAEIGGLENIVVEITEQDMVEDYSLLRARVASIQERGGLIAVDDTGSGYASLKHVMELRPAFVKLDRFFVENCHMARSRAMFIEMLGIAASRLDAWIIAEGVERSGELGELIRLGVPLAQGFFLGRPAPTMQPIGEACMRDLSAFLKAVSLADSIQRYIDLCAICRTEDEAHSILQRNENLGFVVIADAFNRPLCFIENHPVAGRRRIADLMKVQFFSSPSEVLQRAMARSLETRFDPIAVLNERGEFIGAARIDRLMTGILQSPSAAAQISNT